MSERKPTDSRTPAASGAVGALDRTRLPGWLQAGLNRLLGLPVWLLASAASLILIGFLTFVFFLGFVSGERSVGPHVFFGKVTNKLDTMFFARQVQHLTSQTYNSGLVRLNSEVAIVGTGRDHTHYNPLSQNGGGLTSFGDDVLLLAYNRTLYAASHGGDVRETAIEVPDNNRAAYQALTEDEAWAEYDISPHYLRYNDILAYRAGDEQGLIASYTEFHPDEACYTNTLAKLVLPSAARDIDEVSARAEDWTILFRTRPCMEFKKEHMAMEGHMAGGRLAFAAPSTIYLTSGDFHLDGMRSNGPGIAQDPQAMYGKVLAVDLNTGDGRIVSMGHRNNQGIVVLPSGEVIIVEHGPRGGDELNIIKDGANYGWPLESYGTTYTGSPLPDAISYGRHTRFEPPVFAWMPSIAASGMTLVEGFDESWDGDLVVSALQDQSIYRVRMEGSQPVYSERIEIGSRVRDVHQHTDGRIVLWTDRGELVFLRAQPRVDEGERLREWLEYADYPARVKREMQTVIGRCAECHSLTAGDHERSPSLAEIYGDPIAATTYAGYSAGLKSKSGRWTREALIRFIQDPEDFAPGTTMPPSGVDDKRVAEALVDYLQRRDQEF